VELGLQTIHEKTALKIRRGYPLSCFEQTVKELQKRNIPVIVHIILGLPGESTKEVLETIEYLNALGIQGIKLQLLHILKDTDLAKELPTLSLLSEEEYIALLLQCIAHLSPDIVIHRLTGDGPKELLLAPLMEFAQKTCLKPDRPSVKRRADLSGHGLSKEEIRRDVMTSESLKLYKLIILYFLSKTNQDITNAILSDFILEHGYTDYFSIQETLVALTEDNMIKAHQTHTTSYYTITDKGHETLNYFVSQLPSDTIQEIEAYLAKKPDSDCG